MPRIKYIDVDGSRWHITLHAQTRYDERVPGGPGLIREIWNRRRTGGKLKKRIRQSCIEHGIQPAFSHAYFVSNLNGNRVVLVAAVDGINRYSLLTVWAL